MAAFVSGNSRDSSSPTLVIVAALGLALLLGAMLAIFPFEIVIAVVLAPVFLAVAWVLPELAILVILAVLIGIVPASMVPSIPVAGGQLRGEDFFVVVLFLILLLKKVGQPAGLGGFRPFAAPLIFLLVLAVVSFINALFFEQNGLKSILQEARFFFFWLLAPLIVLAINSRPKLNRALVALGVLALIVSIAAIITQATGVEVFKSSSQDLITLDKSFSGQIRTGGHGTNFVVFMFFLVVARFLLNQTGLIVAALLATIFALEIIGTFGRGLWATTLMGLFLIGWWLGTRNLLKMVLTGTVVAAVALAAMSVIKPDFLAAAATRAFSFQKEVDKGSSLSYRYTENRNVIERLSEQPLGIGLGGMVHPKFNSIMDDNLRRYVHNGYLYLAAKLGVVALIFPFWLAWRFYRQSRTMLSDNPIDSDRALIVALLAAFALIMVVSTIQPEWMYQEGVAFIAMLVGLLAVLVNIRRGEASMETLSNELDSRADDNWEGPIMHAPGYAARNF